MIIEHPWPKYEIPRDVTMKRTLFYKPNKHKLCNPAKKSRKAETIWSILFIWQVKKKNETERGKTELTKATQAMLKLGLILA